MKTDRKTGQVDKQETGKPADRTTGRLAGGRAGRQTDREREKKSRQGWQKQIDRQSM